MRRFNRSSPRVTALVLGPLLLGGCGEDAPIDTYPDRAISMLVPFKMAGGADVFARALAAAATTTLGTEFIIENIPGDDGTLGATMMLDRATDGHNLMVGNAGSMLLAPTVRNLANVRWDAFEPVARIHGEEEFIFLRAGETRFRTIDEVVAFARANPGALKVTGSVLAGIDSFVFQFLQKEANFAAAYAPYSGGGEAKMHFFAGEHDLLIGNYSDLSAELAANQLTPIAVASESSSPIFPDVPTLKSRGWDVVLMQWRGVLAPKGTDTARVRRLAEAFRAALETESWRAFRETSHSIDLFLGPSEYSTFLDSEQRRYEALIDELKLRMN